MGSSVKRRAVGGRDELNAELLTESSAESSLSGSTEGSSTEDAPKAMDQCVNSPLGRPIRKAGACRSSVSADNEDEKKSHFDDSKLKKLSSKLSGQFRILFMRKNGKAVTRKFEGKKDFFYFSR